MKSRKYVPGILIDGRGLRGPKGDKGDPGFELSEITSYITNLTDYAQLTHSHGNVLGYNITGSSSSDGLTLSVGNYLTTAALSNHTHSDFTSVTGTHTHGGIYTITKTGTNISFSSTSNGLTMSVPAYLTTAANSYHSHSDLYIPLASTASFLTTAALSNHSHGVVTALGNITIGSSSNGAVFSVSEGIKQIRLGGNTVGTAATLSTGTILLAGGGIITLSQNGNSITINATGGGGSGIVGTGFTSSSTSSGTDIDVTLGSAGMSLVYPKFLTTARGSSDAIGLNTAITGGSMIGNSSGLSINLPAYLTTAMASNAGSGFIGTGTSVDNSLISMTADSRGITMNIPDYLTTAMQSDASSLFLGSEQSSNYLATDAGSNFAGVGSTLTTKTGTDVAMTFGSDGINLEIPAFITTYAVGGASMDISAGASSDGLASVVFSNSNGVSFGLNGSTITASVETSYLTTAMVSDAGSNFVGLGSAITGGDMTLNSDGLSLNISEGGVVLAGSGTFSQSTGTVIFSNSNGLSFGLSNGTMTGSWASNNYVLTGLSSLLQHTSANSLFSQTYQLTADNTKSLGTSYTSHTHGSIYTSSITGSVMTNSSAGSGLTLGVPAYITSAGAHTHSEYASTNHTHGSVAITGGLGATSASSGLSLSIDAYLTTVPNANIYFSNVSSNNLTFGASTSGSSTTITAKAEASGNIYFSNTNGISFGTSTNGNSTSISASYTVPTVGSISFSNANGITFGSSVSGYTTTVSGSVNAYSASSQLTGTFLTTGYTTHTHPYLGTTYTSHTHTYMASSEPHIRAIGNTSASFTSGSVMLSGVNLTVNTSSTGASQYLQISAPAIGYLYFSNTNNHSWGSSVDGVSTSIYIIT